MMGIDAAIEDIAGVGAGSGCQRPHDGEWYTTVRLPYRHVVRIDPDDPHKRFIVLYTDYYAFYAAAHRGNERLKCRPEWEARLVSCVHPYYKTLRHVVAMWMCCKHPGVCKYSYLEEDINPTRIVDGPQNNQNEE